MSKDDHYKYAELPLIETKNISTVQPLADGKQHQEANSSEACGNATSSSWQEMVFWSELAKNFHGIGKAPKDARNLEMWHLMRCDTCENRINSMRNNWAGPKKPMTREIVRDCLAKKHGIVLSSEQLERALNMILERVEDFLDESTKRQDSFEQVRDTSDQATIPHLLFRYLWQRLMLGVICHGASQASQLSVEDRSFRLIKYSLEFVNVTSMSECDYLFHYHAVEKICHWLRVDSADRERLMRLGVKARLHPVATQDAMNASREGHCKLRRNAHQYFGSLIIYALWDEASSSQPVDVARLAEEPVAPRVIRSALFAISTGNPSTYRTRTITIVDDEIQSKLANPLERFKTDGRAAVLILDKVSEAMESQYELREHDADSLFFSILQHAVEEMSPIVLAYSYRLTELDRILLEKRASLKNSVLGEVRSITHELQEFRQWCQQMRVIFEHLVLDCEIGCGKDAEGKTDHFGASAGDSPEDLQMYLLDTKDSILQLDDRLNVLEQMAAGFREDHQRYRDNRMNRILYLLTVCTFVVMPIQVGSGVYGMNFVDADGNPGIPELTWIHGYLYFWIYACCGSLSAATFIYYQYRKK